MTRTSNEPLLADLLRSAPSRALLAWPIAGLLLALSLVMAPGVALARLHVAVNLDYTSTSAHAVWLARVLEVKRVGAAKHQGTPVELLDVRLRIEQALKGPLPARPVLRHLRVAPNSQPMVNGFMFVELRPGATYLLFLGRDKAGRLVLWANEDSNLVSLSASDLAYSRRLSPKLALVDRLADILSNQLSGCDSGCMAPIWLLSQSETHRQRMKHSAARGAFVSNLLRISRKATDWNDINAAFTVLGQLDHRAVLPELVKRICGAQGPDRQNLQVNSISWLQGFTNAIQVTELRKIARLAKDPPTRAAAARRLGYLTRSGNP
ncbi:MAG: hypothetical protein RBU30_10935 [Polyangia bacterium]|nr:hypothetical protein [Polyangia bacterium]